MADLKPLFSMVPNRVSSGSQKQMWYGKTNKQEKSTDRQWQHYLWRQLITYSGTLPWSNISEFTQASHLHANVNRKHMKRLHGKNGHKCAHFLKLSSLRCLTRRNGWQHTQCMQVTVPQRNVSWQKQKQSWCNRSSSSPSLPMMLCSTGSFSHSSS